MIQIHTPVLLYLCIYRSLKIFIFKELLELIHEEYEGLAFEMTMSGIAAIKRLSIYGFYDNPEIHRDTEIQVGKE